MKKYIVLNASTGKVVKRNVSRDEAVAITLNHSKRRFEILQHQDGRYSLWIDSDGTGLKELSISSLEKTFEKAKNDIYNKVLRDSAYFGFYIIPEDL